MGFSTSIEARFGDCDPAGIVYFPVLFHYCHVAFEETWAGALGVSYPDLVRVQRIGFPTVRVETTFESPVRHGDVVHIDVGVKRIGRSSVDFAFAGRIATRVVLRSLHTKVCTDLDRLVSRPIPEDLRTALGRLHS
jgi:4-hydroxybenzoyl-CoA thioesterase